MTPMHRDRDLAERAAAKLKVFAQPQRLMILSCLLDGEKSVGEIDEISEIGQPALSQQLAELRRADLVRTRRDGTQIFYRVSDEETAWCIRSLGVILDDSSEPTKALKDILPNREKGQGGETTNPGTVAGTASFAKILGK